MTIVNIETSKKSNIVHKVGNWYNHFLYGPCVLATDAINIGLIFTDGATYTRMMPHTTTVKNQTNITNAEFDLITEYTSNEFTILEKIKIEITPHYNE